MTMFWKNMIFSVATDSALRDLAASDVSRKLELDFELNRCKDAIVGLYARVEQALFDAAVGSMKDARDATNLFFVSHCCDF